jgi:hypothetical protein
MIPLSKPFPPILLEILYLSGLEDGSRLSVTGSHVSLMVFQDTGDRAKPITGRG